ncbi:hypothetical protein L6P38_19000 [Bacillus velezensis]|uniref:hypothetical protein n=1 Tax=Bacillus velezensis TaxID=492670 RepID=UPI001F392CFD|nr:hypothetical protein [Bacillus velezensis]MCG0590580.1 hypothetical protein [Bacillus velezensis]
MSKFTEKEVKRAIRDFESAVHDVINAGYNTYQSKIQRLVDLSKSNRVISFIVGPIFSLNVDLNEVHSRRNGSGWIELKLPSNMDEHIAYVLKVFQLVSEDKLSLENESFLIYKQKRIADNIQLYMSEVCYPCLRELTYKLSDLVEDKVDGKNEISDASLKIINYGTLTAQNGSTIAVGQNISQSVNFKSIKEDIMEKVKASGVVSEDSLGEVEELAGELEEELNRDEPDDSKLKRFAQKALEIGENGLLKVLTTVVTDPRWGQAAAQALLNI